MKTGLVLEGGAMRGMFTAGVLDTFLDENIKVDCAVGTSAGALFGVNYISKQHGRVIRYNKQYNSDKHYMGILPLLTEGNIVSTKLAYHDVPRYFDPFDDETYMKSDIPFYACATDIDSGKPCYLRIKSVFKQMRFLRAGGSMPFVSNPVKICGRRFLDGGMSDSIPFRWLRKKESCDKLIVILTREEGYIKKPMSRKLLKMFYRNEPKITELMADRHKAYNADIEELKRWERDGRAFVIRPPHSIKIGRMEKDPDVLQAAYDLGVETARNCMEQLRAFLSE